MSERTANKQRSKVMAASLAGLVVISLFIIVLPILCAVAFSTWNAERQLAESRDLVARAVALTALGESVDDQVGLMQRSARRYQRNGAATEEQKLHKRQDQLLEVLDDMAEQQEDAGPREIVRELQDLVQLPIKEVDKLPVTKAAKRARIETFSEMRELSDDMQQANRRALADRLSALAERNAASRTGLLMGSGVMALLAVILVVLLGRLISYPLGQILDGIRRLGRSELEESIAVRGTAELRQVGRELEWLRNRLRNIDEERNAFLRQVSHDLKTPLTNIKEGGGLLLEGSDTHRPVDVRIVSASNRDLYQAMSAGEFREDLFYRLNVVSMQVPSLCQRREDIVPLANHFLASVCDAQKVQKVYASEALARLMAADWPGNVRQLQNIVEQNVALAVGPVLTAADVERALGSKIADRPKSYDQARQDFTRDYLLQLLQLTEGNVARAARLAKRNRTEFYRIMERHGISPHPAGAEK